MKVKMLFVLALILFSGCKNKIGNNKTYTKKLDSILTNFNENEIVFILGDEFFKNFEAPTERRDEVANYIETNLGSIDGRIKELTKHKELKRAGEEYMKSYQNLKKINDEIIEEYDDYGIIYIPLKKADNFYYLIATNSSSLHGGDWKINQNVITSRIMNTGSVDDPPELEEIFRAKDSFEMQLGSQHLGKLYMFVIKGRYADVSQFINKIKNIGYLWKMEN